MARRQVAASNRDNAKRRDMSLGVEHGQGCASTTPAIRRHGLLLRPRSSAYCAAARRSRACQCQTPPRDGHWIITRYEPVVLAGLHRTVVIDDLAR